MNGTSFGHVVIKSGGDVLPCASHKLLIYAVCNIKRVEEMDIKPSCSHHAHLGSCLLHAISCWCHMKKTMLLFCKPSVSEMANKAMVDLTVCLLYESTVNIKMRKQYTCCFVFDLDSTSMIIFYK
jgi:hypothetical protein